VFRLERHRDEVLKMRELFGRQLPFERGHVHPRVVRSIRVNGAELLGEETEIGAQIASDRLQRSHTSSGTMIKPRRFCSRSQWIHATMQSSCPQIV